MQPIRTLTIASLVLGCASPRRPPLPSVALPATESAPPPDVGPHAAPDEQRGDPRTSSRTNSGEPDCARLCASLKSFHWGAVNWCDGCAGSAYGTDSCVAG